jgi:thymidylate synthase (FAD)
MNLHNLFHFLELRMDTHAQKEIRDLAVQVFELIKPIVPIAAEAFMDFRIGKVVLSRVEIEAIQAGLKQIPGKGENQEFQDKLDILKISF